MAMDSTVGACLLAPELAGLVHAAKWFSRQWETQQATENWVNYSQHFFS